MTRSEAVANLQALYGPPSQAGFGSAVFRDRALSAVYDDAEVETVVVYALGDGAALSGLLIAGRDRHGEATLPVFLLD